VDELDEDEIFWREHGRAHTDEEMEWFRLWFEFLKVSDRQRWSEDVSKYFGDLPDKFEFWWPDHAYLFRTFELPVIEEIESVVEFKSVLEARPSPGDPGMLALAVSLYQTKKELRAAFEKMLSKYHPGHGGRPEFHTFGDVYQVASRPDVVMLKKILAVYRAHLSELKKPEQERMKLWQIEEAVSKEIPLIVKTGESAEYIWKETNVDANLVESRRKSQHATVRKYLNHAEQILENVVIGKFPVYTVSNTKD
jgi:hypothetical protein